MRVNFLQYIEQNKLFLKEDKLLLAVSGGQDSVALTHLLVVENFNFEIAHCNFSLRGDESNDDELFVKDLCKKNNQISCIF